MGARFACVIVIASAIGCSSPSRAPSDASEVPTADAPPLSGEFGGACAKHTDCVSGFCVEPVGNKGGVCTRTCTDDCPTDWECRAVELPQVTLELCIPASPQLCLACVNDVECGGATCLELDGGGRCATPCTDECPTGYTCAVDATGAHAGTFCQPVGGSCTCSDALDGASRSCLEMNSIGSCLGTQTCNAATGWSTCTATTPATETCDGKDNNCNFVIDDGVGGGEPCTNTVAGIGSCPGVFKCEGAVGFECYGQMPATEKCNYFDDDCDSRTDETYPGLNSSCTAGVGACLRYGSQRCNSAGTGLTCSAVAGASGTEACNQIDDNCDGPVDEPFKAGGASLDGDLGTTCAAGLGVCARYGTYICRADGAGTQCSVAAGTNISTETCNYLDDNCDGTVDNGFRNATTGFYDTDQNCGSCGNNCTTQFTAQDSFGACAVGTSAQCVMRCDAGHGNLNGSTFDGCEFTLDATSIYVSTTDTTAVDDGTCGLGPTGTGTGNHPCKTITFGLTRAVMTSRPNVLVADGTYSEGVVLLNGKSVLGGYRADTWERHLSTTNTVIAGATSSGNHDRTVAAINITGATVFEGFVVRGSFNTKPSGNSYAIYISASNANLVVRNNEIFAGRGGAGLTGAPGTKGTQGAAGGGAASANDTQYNARTVNGCSGDPAISTIRAYTNRGALSCGGDDVSGGNGGGNFCPPSSAAGSFPNPGPSEKSGGDGFAGQPGAGAGGGAAGTGADAGDDGFVYQDAFRCTIPLAPHFGVDGIPGQPGTSAAGVTGCGLAGGTVSGTDWTAGGGATGLSGGNGGGGGGGGAGGGGYCRDCRPGAQEFGDHRVGGHGGGGGSGGCGGLGGGAGQPGGGVFGIFITGGSAPAMTNNSITRGGGGSGGNGGIGGAGGLGGSGGAGGQGELFCTDKAGRGGDGGSAGHGSGGGGGCGGSSFGIFTNGIGNYCATNTNTVTGGLAGPGGGGGVSGGSSGGPGTAGVVQACVSL